MTALMSQLEPPVTFAQDAATDRRFYVFTAVVSTLALGLLAWLLILRDADGGSGVNLRFMPTVNASLNAIATALLAAGWVAVRRGNKRLHQQLMVAAFAASSLFLVGYLAYHYVHGDTKFQGVGTVRVVYLSVLASHVLLSMFVVPLALVAFYFAFRRSFDRHRKVTRILTPIWLYVSVTGVVIFFMLRGSAPPLS
jgi:putative membrane protein